MSDYLGAICARCSKTSFELLGDGIESDEVRCKACGLEQLWEADDDRVVSDEWHRLAMVLTNQFVSAGKRPDLHALKQINMMALGGHGSAGKLRGELGKIASHRGPSGGCHQFAAPELVEGYLGDFTVWYGAQETKLQPIELAACAYQQLLRIHPFADANWETATRFLDLILQTHGFLPAVTMSRRAVHGPTADVVIEVAHAVKATQCRLEAARRG